MTDNNKKKVFICYARESPDTLEHFVEKFEDYNPDFKVLYDKKRHSGNMHERFKEFAKQCHIALILVNARLIKPDSYANLHEIPILKQRLKSREVIVLGILLQDVKPDAWNSEGDIYFFPLTNNDLPTIRRVDAYRDKFNRKVAVYKNISDTARDTFQKELREFLLDLLDDHKYTLAPALTTDDEELPQKEKTEGSPTTSLKLRSAQLTGQILKLMTTDRLLYKLEEQLSRNMAFWEAIGKMPKKESNSYAWWYLHWHHKEYKSQIALIRKLEDFEFKHQRIDLEDYLQLLNKRLFDLFKETDGGQCFPILVRLDDTIKHSGQKLARSRNFSSALEMYKEELVEITGHLAKQLLELSGRAKGIINK